jgi:hypothetical protein
MAAERPERRQLARIGPTSNDALSHPEQVGDITRPEYGGSCPPRNGGTSDDRAEGALMGTATNTR